MGVGGGGGGGGGAGGSRVTIRIPSGGREQPGIREGGALCPGKGLEVSQVGRVTDHARNQNSYVTFRGRESASVGASVSVSISVGASAIGYGCGDGSWCVAKPGSVGKRRSICHRSRCDGCGVCVGLGRCCYFGCLRDVYDTCVALLFFCCHAPIRGYDGTRCRAIYRHLAIVCRCRLHFRLFGMLGFLQHFMQFPVLAAHDTPYLLEQRLVKGNGRISIAHND